MEQRRHCVQASSVSQSMAIGGFLLLVPIITRKLPLILCDSFASMAVSLAAESEDSPSRSLWKYDVFLSFRGADVRKNFVSHLYHALNEEGIITFHDDRELPKGNFIWERLEEAINQSRFAIVVISEDYANSQWCLRELSLMVELSEKKLLELIPIFYEIDPSILKSRTRCFNEAFENHKVRFDPETVSRWRSALAKLGNICGWDSKSRNEDSKLVQEVVQDLYERLYSEPSDETTELDWNLSYHKNHIEYLLSMDSEDVQMVGVWGKGGRGKTTIAKQVFDGLSSQFPARCFLKDVKGELQRHGVSHLRKQIMSEVFPKSPLNARCISSDAMKRRLRGKKVLLVLDGVDDVQQLQELAGNCKWFGPGSRIIITTRDKRVLEEHSVERNHEVFPLVPKAIDILGDVVFGIYDFYKRRKAEKSAKQIKHNKLRDEQQEIVPESDSESGYSSFYDDDKGTLWEPRVGKIVRTGDNDHKGTLWEPRVGKIVRTGDNDHPDTPVADAKEIERWAARKLSGSGSDSDSSDSSDDEFTFRQNLGKGSSSGDIVITGDNDHKGTPRARTRVGNIVRTGDSWEYC